MRVSLDADPESVCPVQRGRVDFSGEAFRLTENHIAATGIESETTRTHNDVVETIAVHVSRRRNATAKSTRLCC